MREYEDISIKVGNKVTIEIKKADSSVKENSCCSPVCYQSPKDSLNQHPRRNNRKDQNPLQRHHITAAGIFYMASDILPPKKKRFGDE